ncbi:hypothetical protein [Variovorax paradoxus]|jgi:hypothetical protein|uniref:hypothetical protein n=1 Tax=Variovorax paradoxus TaxID=34073 RepID=UPI0029C8C21E|nr:hypothetical protein [Variovorax paradoxus]WPH23251.1 hypothetical protein RZE78_11395 [Variovorax paradoxus]
MPPPEGEEIVFGYASTGLTLRRHPLALLRERLAGRGLMTARDLDGIESGAQVSHCGIVTLGQQPETAKGTIFVTLEDEAGGRAGDRPEEPQGRAARGTGGRSAHGCPRQVAAEREGGGEEPGRDAAGRSDAAAGAVGGGDGEQGFPVGIGVVMAYLRRPPT